MIGNFTDTQLLQATPLFVGMTFLAVGLLLLKFTPKKINYLYGYRTPASMRNQKNWDFSQKYSAIEFMRMGILLTLYSIIILALKLEWANQFTSIAIIIITTVVFAFTRTELAIKKINR